MILIDSSGWLEYFGDGLNADIFAEALFKSKGDIIVPTIVLYEIFKKVLSNVGEEQALQIIGQLKRYRVIPLSEDISLMAAKISHEYKLPMADSIIYAAAKVHNAEVWTQDEDFKDLKSVKYIKKKKIRHNR